MPVRPVTSLIWSRPSHGSPHSETCSPAAPQTPLHRRILVHLGGFHVFLGKFICGAQLLVMPVLLGSTDVSLVMSWIREDVIGFSSFLDHRDFAWRKVLELLLLGGRLGSNHHESGGYQHVFSVLRAGLRGGAAEQQRCARGSDRAKEDKLEWSHGS